MNQAEIVASIARKSRYKKDTVERILDFLALEVSDSLKKGKSVHFVKLGRFTAIDRKDKPIITVYFKANTILKTILNQ